LTKFKSGRELLKLVGFHEETDEKDGPVLKINMSVGLAYIKNSKIDLGAASA
jgi:hypothetical protein